MKSPNTDWEWMQQRAGEAPERGLQTLLVELVEEIERAMEAQGLTRTEVAKRAGVKREYVARILNNPSNVTLATVVRLCNAVSRKLYVQLLPHIEARFDGMNPVMSPCSVSAMPRKVMDPPPCASLKLPARSMSCVCT